MNADDLENVYFLLNATEDVLRDWYKKTSQDDHKYAVEILKQYGKEIALKLSLLQMDTNPIISLEEANEHLSSYRL